MTTEKDKRDLERVARGGASAIDDADRLEELGIESQLDDAASREEAKARLGEAV